SGDQIRAVDRAIDRHFAPFPAADRADLLALCGAKPLRRPLFTNRAAHAHSSSKPLKYEGNQSTRRSKTRQAAKREACLLPAGGLRNGAGVEQRDFLSNRFHGVLVAEFRITHQVVERAQRPVLATVMANKCRSFRIRL